VLLTPVERRQLRHLLRKGGCEHLIEAVPQLAKRVGGRPESLLDKYMLTGAEFAVRVIMRERHMTRTDALQRVAETF